MPKNFATQIWPFREDYAADMPATLDRLAQSGFAGVELCRFYHWTDMFDKWSAEEIRTASRQAGIRIISSHVSYPTILPENLPDLIRFCHTVEMSYAIVAAVPEDQANTRDLVLRVADRFNAAAAALASEGIRIGYHNHGFDFKPLPESGELPWDLFFANTDPAIIMQVDTGNACKGGADPLEYLRQYPGRARLVHLKEYDPATPPEAIGDGVIDWNTVMQLSEEHHQPEWYIIEQEEKEYDPWTSAQRSLDYLRSLGW